MKGFRTWLWIGLVVGLLGLLGLGGALMGSASAATPWNEEWCDDHDGRGMMGSGMMGRGMMMGDWEEDCPLLGDAGSSLWSRSDRDDAEALNLEEVEETVTAFLTDLDENLVLAEIMEFDNHFYAEAVERDTGIGAYELLIDRYTGKVYPEMGPNMMWNEKYGMMGRGMMSRWGRNFSSDELSVTPEEAVELAGRYLDKRQTGLTPDDEVTSFYGYYTLHVLEDGDTVGMLSVNSDTGDVWPHVWHGDFVRMTDDHDGGRVESKDAPVVELGTFTNISAGRLAGMLKDKDFLLINVHVPYEGELRQTDLFIPFDEISENRDLLPTDKEATIVVYCRSGSMSAAAVQDLQDLGYINVYNLTAGMREWQAAGYDLLTRVK